MRDFNLLVSTSRDYEMHAESELWFHLLILGDEAPIISKVGIPGLLIAKTHVDPRVVIKHFHSIIQTTDPNYIQFIQKIYPIDRVVISELDVIKAAALDLIKTHPLCQKSDSLYRITIRKRNTSLKTDDIIPFIAQDINYQVDLKNFDWNLEIEIIGDFTGIAIITEDDIFKPISEARDLIPELQNEDETGFLDY
jgi:tRNA acetyltransferase TAN1